jgi:hypothetical protein
LGLKRAQTLRALIEKMKAELESRIGRRFQRNRGGFRDDVEGCGSKVRPAPLSDGPQKTRVAVQGAWGMRNDDVHKNLFFPAARAWKNRYDPAFLILIADFIPRLFQDLRPLWIEGLHQVFF